MKTADATAQKATLDAWAEQNAVSEAEMDQLHAAHREEIDALLREAYDAVARGECEVMPPLDAILADARHRDLGQAIRSRFAPLGGVEAPQAPREAIGDPWVTQRTGRRR